MQMGINPLVTLSYTVLSKTPWIIDNLIKVAEGYRQKGIRNKIVERFIQYYYFSMGVYEKLREYKNA